MRRSHRAPLRTPTEVAAMRRAGRVVAEMHEVCREAIRPGVTTAELDQRCRDVLERRGATSNFLGYGGFPAVLCVSVNDEVVHGIPGPRRLQEGDLVSIDCGAVVDGWHGDAAFTTSVGEPAPGDDALGAAARRSLEAAIDQLRPGRTLGDVGAAIETVVAEAGFSLLDDHCGHGIGRAMHEAPDVLNTGRPGRGLALEVGMVLAIEPMVCAGGPDYRVLDDGWTVVTADGARGAHWEHTVAVTEHGPEVLTLP